MSSIRRCGMDVHVEAQGWLALVVCGLCTVDTACTSGFPVGTGVVSLAPSSARSGTDGTDGSFGVARTTIETTTRATDVLTVEVSFPSDAMGRVDRSALPCPVVVFVQGGLVPYPRYRWIADHLASRGYVVIMPAHVGNLAFFETDNASIALRALREASGDHSEGALLTDIVSAHSRVATMGHSLGAVVAERQWTAGTGDVLVLLAGYPAQGDTVLGRAGAPVLSLVGDQDTRKAPAEAYVTGFGSFAPPRWFGLVRGMNHYAWTDEFTVAETSGDGPLLRPLADVRRDAFRMLDDFLDATLRNNSRAGARLEAGNYENIGVQR